MIIKYLLAIGKLRAGLTDMLDLYQHDAKSDHESQVVERAEQNLKEAEMILESML